MKIDPDAEVETPNPAQKKRAANAEAPKGKEIDWVCGWKRSSRSLKKPGRGCPSERSGRSVLPGVRRHC
jgi:hypothetical protein